MATSTISLKKCFICNKKYLNDMDDVLLKFFGFKYIVDSKNGRRRKKF